MKPHELRELSPAELAEKIESLDQELFNLRFQAKLGRLENPVQMKYIRRERARTKTIMHEMKRQSAHDERADTPSAV